MSKLLYITTNLQGSGGVSRVLSVKLDYLIKKYNYTVHVVTTNNKSGSFFYKFNKDIVFHKIDIVDFGFWKILKYKKLLQNVIDEVKPAVIINCDNGFKGALLPYLTTSNASLIYEMHGSKDMVFNKWFDHLKFKLSNFIIQKSIKKYDRFVVLTSSHTKEWRCNTIQVIHNPITISHLISKKSRQKVVLAIGRFSSEKGYERLLKMWSKISQVCPDWRLDIFGSGDKHKYLSQLKKLNISNTVVLKDPVSNIQEEYAKAAFLVNTSYSEAFPLSMIEGMYSSLPVVTFDTLGAKQLIKNEENGYLISQNDESDFVDKVLNLIKNEEELLAMSNNAIKSAQKYNLDVIMKQWHELFQSLN